MDKPRVVPVTESVDRLFEYIENAIYSPGNAVLDIDKLPDEFQDLGNGLQYFIECVLEANVLAKALAKGDLNVKAPPSDNEMASSLKSLHASLKHLAWQAEQVAKGDYNQRVSFMGEFSESFNTMVTQLAERQKNLENEIIITQQKSASLEQGAALLTALIQYVPQQIFVVEEDSNRILMANDIAKKELEKDPDYIINILRSKPETNSANNEHEAEIKHSHGGQERFFSVKFYTMGWYDSNATIIVASDISAAKIKMEALEAKAYKDVMTQLYNRAWGMYVLDEWLKDKRRFVLIFVDLDKLKYVNDEFGHTEGDIYIINAGNCLKSFSVDCIPCRLGGDEFMLLAPDIGYEEARETMNRIVDEFKNHSHLSDKSFSYSMSVGIVAVGSDNDLSLSSLLDLADARMYADKRSRKAQRKDDLV